MMRLRQLLFLSMISVATSGCETDSPQRAHASATAPTQGAATVALESWNPSQPVDLDRLNTRRYFVTADSASICPTVEGARDDECGNSVEFADQGYVVRRGEALTVVGDSPVEGFWRAIRFSKPGTLPGWVDAKRIAPKPDLQHVQDFRVQFPDADRIVARDINFLSRREDPDSGPHEPLVFEVRDNYRYAYYRPPSCFGRRDAPEQRYKLFHNCLIYADCIHTDYSEHEGFQDEIFIERGEVETMTYMNRKISVHTVVSLADRMGVFVDCSE